MRNIVYDVAISADGFIAGPEQAVDAFLNEGQHATDYFERLKSYDTAIMGRSTYEFAYKYGLKPGSRVYPHMRHFIYSQTISVQSNEHVEVVRKDIADHISKLKSGGGSDLYLCGGGKFAGFLLEKGLIDKLILKINPVVFGTGVKLFETEYKPFKMKLTHQSRHDNGVIVNTYSLR